MNNTVMSQDILELFLNAGWDIVNVGYTPKRKYEIVLGMDWMYDGNHNGILLPQGRGETLEEALESLLKEYFNE